MHWVLPATLLGVMSDTSNMNGIVISETGWSHVAGSARPESCAAIYLINMNSGHTSNKPGWSHAWVLHGPEGSAVVSLNINMNSE